MKGALTELDPARERAVDAALEILETRGPNALTLGEVANRLNLPVVALQRTFETYDDLLEALAERWLRDKVAIMEEVVASDLPPRRKMYEFFARRFVLMRDSYRADPALFQMHVELGNQHFEIVRSYVDLGDHYCARSSPRGIDDGHFAGLVDRRGAEPDKPDGGGLLNIALMVLAWTSSASQAGADRRHDLRRAFGRRPRRPTDNGTEGGLAELARRQAKRDNRAMARRLEPISTRSWSAPASPGCTCSTSFADKASASG